MYQNKHIISWSDIFDAVKRGNIFTIVLFSAMILPLQEGAFLIAEQLL